MRPNPLSKGIPVINLPETPVNSSVILAATGLFAVTGYFIKKSSNDRQHLVNANLEAKKIDAQMQAEVMKHLVKTEL
jgi:hypothetical protein